MRFTWDPQKNEATRLRRRFDFKFATLIFDGPTLERDDNRHDYGERRVIATGLADRIFLTVVYTDRPVGPQGLERRIISARRSNTGERRAYAETFPQAAEPGPSRP